MAAGNDAHCHQCLHSHQQRHCCLHCLAPLAGYHTDQVTARIAWVLGHLLHSLAPQPFVGCLCPLRPSPLPNWRWQPAAKGWRARHLQALRLLLGLFLALLNGDEGLLTWPHCMCTHTDKQIAPKATRTTAPGRSTSLLIRSLLHWSTGRCTPAPPLATPASCALAFSLRLLWS